MMSKEKDAVKDILRMSGVDPKKCMKCGKCSASCPAFDSMDIHPHQVVSMIEEGNLDPLLKSQSLWKCLSCFACVQRCPRSVEPARLIEAVRVMLIRGQGKNHLKAEEIPQILNDRIPQQAITSAFRKYSK